MLRHPTSQDALSHTNRIDIKAALNVAMTDLSIRQVKFCVDHDGSIVPRFEVEATISDELSTFDKKTPIKTLTITLHCRLDQRIPPAPTEPDPPVADVPEHPPIQIP